MGPVLTARRRSPRRIGRGSRPPRFPRELSFDLPRGFRAFAKLDAGIARPETPRPGHAEDRSSPGGVQTANVLWVFSFGRSGSTWLSAMLGELQGYAVWLEPSVGALFGNFYYSDPWITEAHRQHPSFVMGSQREIWLGLIRSFFLDAARAMVPAAGHEETLVVKETYGSVGAPLLMKALPESAMIFLLRDPRDVVASNMDAFKPASWGSLLLGEDTPDFDARDWAGLYRRNVGNIRQAYEDHAGRKALVRYEDLWADTLGTMKRACSSLEIALSEEELAETVARHSWERIPENQKGAGRFHRSGEPGRWRQDLTAEEAEAVEQVAAPIFAEFYS